ncbi:MAG: hypothetical protein K2O32_05970 [Acetatifactor sp.]|nr:hypothetical protein [Acetatifactor sp.]
MDSTLDKIIYFTSLTHGNKEYVEAGASQRDDDTIYITYYTKKDIDDTILCKIIIDNKFICEPYQLEEVEVKQISKKEWKIQLDEEVLGKIEIERNFVMWKICYMWDKMKLEARDKYENR